LESNLEKYQDAITHNGEVDIFLQPWWLDIVCGKGKWLAYVKEGHNNRIDGIWPVPLDKKYLGLQLSRQPAFTPILGMRIFVPDQISKNLSQEKFKNKTVAYFLSEIKKTKLSFLNQYFPQSFQKVQEFKWEGFKNEVYSRYYLDGIKNHDAVLNNFSGDIKANIKKAEKSFSISKSEDENHLFPFIQGNILDVTRFQSLLKESISRTKSKILYGYKDEQIVGGCFILLDKKKAYLLCMGVDKEHKNSGFSSLLIWEGIKFASEHLDTFDFGGSMIPGISKFMQGFSGNKLSYLRMRYYKSQITKLLFTAANKD